MSEEEKIIQYIDNAINCISKLKNESETIRKIFQLISECRQKGNNIYLIGNGGSASTASHFVCDLNKTSKNDDLPDSRAFALNDNSPIVFAIANDIGFEYVFEEQLKGLLKKNDLLIAISGSGNSENVIRAVNYAKTVGAISIGLTGYDGGQLKKLCQECLIVPSDKMYHIEDIHLMINHIITFLFTGYSYK